MSELDVWLFGSKAGTLAATGRAGLSFQYEMTWIEGGLPAISQSLPLKSDVFTDPVVQNFFGNLLPEGDVRQHLARLFGVSVNNDFRLLEVIGGDCAGAISLMPPGQRPVEHDHKNVHWLDEQTLAATIDTLPYRPLLADPDEGIRLSLAGAQDKVPIVFQNGRFGLPMGGTPSTHILKTMIPRFDDTVINEAYCLQLAASLGLQVCSAHVHKLAGKEVLLVERYDRVILNQSDVERLHQEDFCQALGIPSENKYQASGGPGVSECFELLRRVSDRPAHDLLEFIDAFTVNFLVGNHDAHAKNFSLLYHKTRAELAPFYDLISTVVYPGLTRKMAMQIGREYRPQYVRTRHIERFAVEAGVGISPLKRRILELVKRADELAPKIASNFRNEGYNRGVLNRIMDTITARAAHLKSELQ